LKIILKSVVIIAIVAVAMIGIIVTSGFSAYAEQSGSTVEAERDAYYAAKFNTITAKAAVTTAAEKIASLDEKLGKSHTRSQAEAAAEIRKEARDEHKAAIDALAKAIEEEKLAKYKWNKFRGAMTCSGIDQYAICQPTEAEDTVPKWVPERNYDDYQTGVKEVSPEESKQRMKEMFGGTGLPMPGFSEGLKDPLPTEKEMFDSGTMQKAYSPKAYDPPKAKPWWCFWC
jgi:hypothetical protein